MSAAFVTDAGQALPFADERVALTKQDNDLLKEGSVQASYFNTLTLADTPEVRAALEQAQFPLSATDTLTGCCAARC